MEQRRLVDTPAGAIAYTLVRKQVKNLNLKVRVDGTVALSIPVHCSDQRADDMVREKSGWLAKVLARQREQSVPTPPMPSRAVCVELLGRAVERVYPLVRPLGVALPELKARKMRSQWGNCHWRQGYITLNTALARCPEELRDYVALHELVHFLHHDHGPGFYEKMDRLMPDWKARRARLRHYGAALEERGEESGGE